MLLPCTKVVPFFLLVFPLCYGGDLLITLVGISTSDISIVYLYCVAVSILCFSLFLI